MTYLILCTFLSFLVNCAKFSIFQFLTLPWTDNETYIPHILMRNQNRHFWVVSFNDKGSIFRYNMLFLKKILFCHVRGFRRDLQFKRMAYAYPLWKVLHNYIPYETSRYVLKRCIKKNRTLCKLDMDQS